MLFSSLEFLFLFLPLSLCLYFILPRRWRNLSLLVSGLVFYAFGEIGALPVMLLSIALNYAFALILQKLRGKRSALRYVLAAAVAYNIGQLVYFKLQPLSELPIGISFYTFQALSYVIDVYRESVEANRSLIDFGAYISLYPQLVAGPIVRYSDIAAELRERRHGIDLAADGLRRFCAGLSKKVLLANTAGAMWELFALREGFFDAYLGVFFFAMQIYFDFSGYSDMAIGLGKVFGFSFPENFNYPYTSTSITDFWRRWHITLSSFFREYVYISLGGNRRGKLITYRNLLITWALTGLWHGFSLNFLLWGLYFALILIIEKAYLGKLIASAPRLLQRSYSLLLIAIGWVIFASDGSLIGISEGGAYILRLFGIGCSELCASLTLYELWRNAAFILILILGATPLPRRIYLFIKKKTPRVFATLSVALPLAAFLLSVAYIVNSGYNPFLYFRF